MAECLVPVLNISYFVNNAKPCLVTGSRVKGITNPYRVANKNPIFTLYIDLKYVQK